MRTFAFALVAIALTGCAALTNFRQEGLKKAAFDLGCPEDKVSMKELSKTEVNVTGCGKRATYTENSGAWTTNSVKSE